MTQRTYLAGEGDQAVEVVVEGQQAGEVVFDQDIGKESLGTLGRQVRQSSHRARKVHQDGDAHRQVGQALDPLETAIEPLLEDAEIGLSQIGDRSSAAVEDRDVQLRETHIDLIRRMRSEESDVLGLLTRLQDRHDSGVAQAGDLTLGDGSVRPGLGAP